mmetsp:Transcript_2795/g.5226  ORF Transcript_2795/g.5226 Transcript_2795/m.5226 type:complete len:270 (-) Transcript_2795:144-953(-)
MVKFPAIFVNHGGGPLPLIGQQPQIATHLQDQVQMHFPQKPSAIVVISAHWEDNPVKISSSSQPKMIYDYYGFPSETYQYKYPAPGSPSLANKIKHLLESHGIESELDPDRGFDHGVFVPLLLMQPQANIPVVCLSLDSSLSPEKHIAMGKALAPLRDENILLLGSGYTFHNLPAFFNPSETTLKASHKFNDWLKEVILEESGEDGKSSLEENLIHWENAPGARTCHPREEHLLPLFVVAASGDDGKKNELIYDEQNEHEFAVSGYVIR